MAVMTDAMKELLREKLREVARDMLVANRPKIKLVPKETVEIAIATEVSKVEIDAVEDLVGFELYSIRADSPLPEWAEIFSVEKLSPTVVHLHVLFPNGLIAECSLDPGMYFRFPWTADNTDPPRHRQCQWGRTVDGENEVCTRSQGHTGACSFEPVPPPEAGEQCLRMTTFETDVRRRTFACTLPKGHAGGHKGAPI